MLWFLLSVYVVSITCCVDQLNQYMPLPQADMVRRLFPDCQKRNDMLEVYNRSMSHTWNCGSTRVRGTETLSEWFVNMCPPMRETANRHCYIHDKCYEHVTRQQFGSLKACDDGFCDMLDFDASLTEGFFAKKTCELVASSYCAAVRIYSPDKNN